MKKNKKKPRTTIMELNFGEPVTINEISVNSVTGELIASHDGKVIKAKSAKLINKFKGENKTRFLNQVPISLVKFTLNHNYSLTDYNLLFAIDTNTAELGQNTVSVSCLVNGEIETISGELTLKTYLLSAFAMWNVKEKPENLAWMYFIEAIQRNPNYHENLKIGLVVDSDLGNIDDYNARKVPIYEEFFLPKNMELIYAGSGKGRDEFFSNKMLSLTDAEAGKLLNEAKLLYIAGHDTFLGSFPIENMPFTYFKVLIQGRSKLKMFKLTVNQSLKGKS